MFDDPPADLEARDDLYRVDVLRYGQTGLLDDIADLSMRGEIVSSSSLPAVLPAGLSDVSPPLSVPVHGRRLRLHWGLAPGLSRSRSSSAYAGGSCPSSSSHFHQHRRFHPITRRSRGEPINVAVRCPLFPMTGALIPTASPRCAEGDPSPSLSTRARLLVIHYFFSSLSYDAFAPSPQRADPLPPP